jgi:hypothetical protein
MPPLFVGRYLFDGELDSVEPGDIRSALADFETGYYARVVVRTRTGVIVAEFNNPVV